MGSEMCIRDRPATGTRGRSEPARRRRTRYSQWPRGRGARHQCRRIATSSRAANRPISVRPGPFAPAGSALLRPRTMLRWESGIRSTFWPRRGDVSRAAVAKLAVASVAAEQRRRRSPARVASRASGAVAQEQPLLALVRCKWRSRGIAPRRHCGRMCTCHRSMNSNSFARSVRARAASVFFCCCAKTGSMRGQEPRYACDFARAGPY